MFLSTIKYSWLREASHDQPVSGALNTTPNKMHFSFFNRVYHHALNLYFLLLRRILGRGTQEGGTHVYTELLLSSSRNQHNIVKRPHTLKGRKEGRGTRAKVRSPEEEQRSWPETDRSTEEQWEEPTSKEPAGPGPPRHSWTPSG